MILCCIPIYQLPSTNSNSLTSSANENYLLIKVDDVGNSLDSWIWFYDLIMNDSRLNVDLGVMALPLLRNPFYMAYFKANIINNPQFGIFNHGWDHIVPEFENRSYSYMYSHIQNWDNFMKLFFSYTPKVKVLGAPGNAIGNKSDCSLDLYSVLAQLNYNLLYFSQCTKSSPTGRAGGDLLYIPFELNGKPRSLDDILGNFDKYQNEKYVLTQIHPSLYWNASYLEDVLTQVLESTHRRTMHIQDYYTNVFIVNNSNFFLKNMNSYTEFENIINCQMIFNSVTNYRFKLLLEGFLNMYILEIILTYFVPVYIVLKISKIKLFFSKKARVQFH